LLIDLRDHFFKNSICSHPFLQGAHCDRCGVKIGEVGGG
jgi:hypothetical protein